MFFVLPTAAIFAIYILAAVLPAIFLLRYIYKHDTVDKEPPGLLLSLILMGIVAALMSIVLEIVGEKILNDQISQDDKYLLRNPSIHEKCQALDQKKRKDSREKQ